MRKMWALALAPLLTFAFLMLGSAPANAFGSEVLGCNNDAPYHTGWQADRCYVGGDYYWVGDVARIDFVPHYLSGTYTYAWSVGNQSTSTFYPFTRSCTSDTDYNCILTGCTTTTSTCSVAAKVGATSHDVSASLKLTQSGLSRTISATASVLASHNY